MNEFQLWTPQEHKIIGSSVDDEHYKTPYTPLAIIEGIISIEECNRLREEKGKMPRGSTAGMFYGIGPIDTILSLEELNTDPTSLTYGQTVRDPILLWYDKEDFTDYTGIDLSDFVLPFRRNGLIRRLEDE